MNSESESHFRYDVIIFDLDGTLINSCLDLANSVNFTRVQMGLRSLDNELIYNYIGDGASMLIRRALGPDASEALVNQALEIFLGHYKDHLLDNTVLYPGVKEALDELESVTLAVLTNKPLNPSSVILEGLGVREKFAWVYGGNSFGEKKPDPVGIYRILESARVSKERAIMVGDSWVDVKTGHNAGITACGVTYGLASHTLHEIQPDYLIDDLRALVGIVNGHSKG